MSKMEDEDFNLLLEIDRKILSMAYWEACNKATRILDARKASGNP